MVLNSFLYNSFDGYEKKGTVEVFYLDNCQSYQCLIDLFLPKKIRKKGVDGAMTLYIKGKRRMKHATITPFSGSHGTGKTTAACASRSYAACWKYTMNWGSSWNGGGWLYSGCNGYMRSRARKPGAHSRHLAQGCGRGRFYSFFVTDISKSYSISGSLLPSRNIFIVAVPLFSIVSGHIPNTK